MRKQLLGLTMTEVTKEFGDLLIEGKSKLEEAFRKSTMTGNITVPDKEKK